jgi:hypothetical protein
MNALRNSPELAYLSPTTRERAIVIAQELLSQQKISYKEAIATAVELARSWATRNLNRKVWKKLGDGMI